MRNAIMGILAIILGVLVIAFPLVGVVAVSFIAGFAVIMLAIWFLIAGVAEMYVDRVVGILTLILGIIALIIGFGLLLNPALFAFLTGIVLYLAGILMIIAGIISLLGGMEVRYRVWGGVLGIILGIIYIILGTFAFNPLYLGFIIGIWLLLIGIFSFFAPSQ
ncbi:MAG: hypothetical protein A4E27_00805 [Methanobacterium sp. PtaU1.Bin242]|nr:MAG: hypothetical protein A4E27_00805 [Methanobacterium sp. PtaU1.Bin242]